MTPADPNNPNNYQTGVLTPDQQRKLQNILEAGHEAISVVNFFIRTAWAAEDDVVRLQPGVLGIVNGLRGLRDSVDAVYPQIAQAPPQQGGN